MKSIQSQEGGKDSAISAPSTDTIYILDSSRSMGDKLGQTKTSKLELSKAGLVTVLSKAKSGKRPHRVGILSVNTSILGKPIINEVIPFGEIVSSGVQAQIPIERIMLLRNEGGTALLAGVEFGLSVVSKNNSPNVSRNIVVITDCRSNTPWQNGAILTTATKTRTRVHFVLLGEERTGKFDQFKTIAELTGGHFTFANSSSELERGIVPIVEEETPAVEGKSAESKAKEDQVENRNRIQNPAFLIPVSPKRKKSETMEEIVASVSQLTAEYSELEASLKEGRVSQIQFTEKYSMIQYELTELRQSIRELRSKLNREITEIALAKERTPDRNEGSLKQTSNQLVELDRRIASLQKSAELV